MPSVGLFAWSCCYYYYMPRWHNTLVSCYRHLQQLVAPTRVGYSLPLYSCFRLDFLHARLCISTVSMIFEMPPRSFEISQQRMLWMPASASSTNCSITSFYQPGLLSRRCFLHALSKRSPLICCSVKTLSSFSGLLLPEFHHLSSLLKRIGLEEGREQARRKMLTSLQDVMRWAKGAAFLLDCLL